MIEAKLFGPPVLGLLVGAGIEYMIADSVAQIRSSKWLLACAIIPITAGLGAIARAYSEVIWFFVTTGPSSFQGLICTAISKQRTFAPSRAVKP